MKTELSKSENLILSIDTATSTCSVALHTGNKLIGSIELRVDQSHSRVLNNMINDLMSYAGASLTELAAIAISSGPGSYTGLRIGASTAKGLSYGLDKPLIAVNTLEAMAIGILSDFENVLVCPMIDARRMEVYCLIMDKSENIISPIAPKVIDEESFSDLLDENKMVFFGDGADKCEPVLRSHTNAHFIMNKKPSAADVGIIAFRKWLNQEFEDTAYYEPFYLKEFKAGKPKQLI